MAGCQGITCIILCLFLLDGISGFNLDVTIPIIKEGPGGSYFGFSVAQHQQLRDDKVIGNYILVGAPHLNILSAHENDTGGVYRCDATSPLKDDCELLLTKEYNQRAQKDKGKNGQWLGVTVRSGGRGGAVVACAHRYKTTDNNYGLGNCYQMEQDLKFDPYLGSGNKISPCQGLSVRNEHEEYAFCQAGTSAYVSTNDILVVGAPGAINWRGMLSEVDISPRMGIKRLYRSPTTNSDSFSPPVAPMSYLGFSVIAGKFDSSGQMYYIAAAPRSNDLGQVIFFTEMASGSTVLKYEETQIITGELPFSGFGNDLMATDINGDGFDDLIIGCPFYYSKEKDSIRVGGAIYIYSGNGEMITQYTKPQVIRGRTLSQEECDLLDCLHSRFGFSLGKSGDLNRDGFQDFAVGAPYEGKGAVYIFHGSKDGVKEVFSQRIYAEDIAMAAGWTTFGYSLSGGLDLDDNSYPDLAIGSYEMSKVALLRTRPIIHLHSNVTVTPQKLNMSSDNQKQCEYGGKRFYCIDLKLCLRYTAEPVERYNESLNIHYTIVAEPDRINARVEFKTGFGAMQKVEDMFRLLPQTVTGIAGTDIQPRFACTIQTAFLKEQISDVLSEIKFGISYRLPERTGPISTPSPGALPDINEYPILDAGLTQAETMLYTEVEFVKQCGDDNVCVSSLLMDVTLDLKYNKQDVAVLELGVTKILKVKVHIKNAGEIAYQPGFYFTKPRSLTWQNSDPKDMGCNPVNSTMIECKDIGSSELGKPLKASAVSEFTLYFGVDNNEMSSVRSIELSAWVNTTSQLSNNSRSHLVIPVVVYVNADLQVSGKSDPDSAIQYSGQVIGESAITEEHMIGQSVNHTFTIFNNGPGVIQSSQVTILWPYELASKYPHGKHLLYLLQPPQVLDGGDASCFDQPEIINVANIKEDFALNTRPGTQSLDNDLSPEYTVANGRRRRAVDTKEEDEEPPADAEDDGPVVGAAKEKKHTVVLDCEKKTAKCHKIRCIIGNLENNANVKIRIRARLWESTLLEDFRNVDEVQIRSIATLHIRPELNVVQEITKNDKTYVTTIAIPSLKIVAEKPLEWWIIALAVLGGILLLILLAVCLWKIGFFKRQRYDNVTTYNVKVQKKKDIHNPTYDTRVELQKEYDENDMFINKH